MMFGGLPEWGEFSPLPHYIRVELTDTGQDVWVQLGRFSGTDPSDGTHYDEDDIHVVADPGRGARRGDLRPGRRDGRPARGGVATATRSTWPATS